MYSVIIIFIKISFLLAISWLKQDIYLYVILICIIYVYIETYL